MKTAWAGALAGLVLLLGAAPAAAHAAYKDSNPADESSVSSPPSEVWAEFTEPVTQDSYLQIFDPCGRQVDHGNSSPTGTRITISMSGTAAGTYRVAFAVVSSLDGHPTRGEFTFTSTGGEPCPGAAPPPSREEERRAAPDEEVSEDEAGAPEAEAGADPAPPVRDRADRRMQDRREHGGHRDRDPAERTPGDEVMLTQATPQPPVPPPGVPGEIPLRGLVIGLSAAALIGAAGGMVYAGLMGPRR